MNIAPWLIANSTVLLASLIGLFQRIHKYYSGSIHSIRHVKMHIIKVLYQAFIALPIQTDITKNSSIDTNTGISIGPSLVSILLSQAYVK